MFISTIFSLYLNVVVALGGFKASFTRFATYSTVLRLSLSNFPRFCRLVIHYYISFSLALPSPRVLFYPHSRKLYNVRHSKVSIHQHLWLLSRSDMVLIDKRLLKLLYYNTFTAWRLWFVSLGCECKGNGYGINIINHSINHLRNQLLLNHSTLYLLNTL